MRRITIAVVALLLAACAAPRYAYERRSATPAQIDHDLGVCRREGFRPSRFAVWPSDRYDWEVVNRCMQRKGYSVRVAED